MHHVWSILAEVSGQHNHSRRLVSPVPPSVMVTAPPPGGTVHQLVSHGRIIGPGVRNHPEEDSVFGSRNLRKYVAVYLR
jgi:hypothetical protein